MIKPLFLSACRISRDYRYSDTVKFFVEYYAEEETAAITAERAGSEVFDRDASGGSARAAGVSLNLAWL
jgi:hypothetical protein